LTALDALQSPSSMTPVLAPRDNLHAPHPWLQSLAHDFPGRAVDVGGGARVSVRQAGAAGAPALVLLHGIGSGSASWLPVVRELGPRAHVIAWDAPGYGESTALPAAAPTAGDYAERLRAVLDALALSRVMIVGHSLGALMATAFAARHPERVHRLVLLAPAGGYGAPSQAARAAEVRQERLGTLERLGIEGMARERGPRLVRAAANDDLRSWAVWNMARLRPEGYRQAVELLCGSDLTAWAPLAVPLEVHVGDEDRVTPPERVAHLAAAFGVPHHLIHQSGHLCPLDQATAVADLLARALHKSDAVHLGSTGQLDTTAAAQGGRA
jgi:pimeloyl-ACP methyl ester carboxylesterase